MTRMTPVQFIDKNRLEALSDGVLSIAMTLLVFDLKIPELYQAKQLGPALAGLWSNFLGFSISFVLLGIYSLGHRTMFHRIERTDHALHWINIFFLALVSLVPFTTKMIGRFPHETIALTLYGMNLVLIGLTLFWMWEHATTGRRLVDADMSRSIVRLGKVRCLIAPCLYALGMLSLLVDDRLCLGIYTLVPIVYMVPAFQKHWERLGGVPFET